MLTNQCPQLFLKIHLLVMEGLVLVMEVVGEGQYN